MVRHEYYRVRKSMGLCVQCGKKIPKGHKLVRCPICSRKMREWAKSKKAGFHEKKKGRPKKIVTNVSFFNKLNSEIMNAEEQIDILKERIEAIEKVKEVYFK